MNKLTALVSKKVGKKSQYEEIAEATYGAATTDKEALDGNDESIERERSNLSLPTAGNDRAANAMNISPSRMSSSTGTGFGQDIEETPPSLCLYLLRNAASVTIIILLTIICALSGERASTRGEAADLVEDKMTAGSIKWRPCQIYLDNDLEWNNKKQLLQTSLGDPSTHWGQVPCLVRKRKPSYSKFYEDQNWNWFGSSTFSSDKQEPIEYGQPSAQIRTNFGKKAHPNRQPIMGFGGAFTEATALNFMTLNKSGKDAIIELLFGKSGLGYTLGRVPMNSCDFSPKSYNFDDVEDDFTLEHFDNHVEHDVMSGMIGMMLQADGKVSDSWPDDRLDLFASPWSPPAWMKKPTQKDAWDAVHAVNMTNSPEPNCLREGTGPDSRYAKSWALYFSKFVSAYKSWGLNLFAVTVQNEPEFPAPWEACAYNPDNQAEFIANHLGPRLDEDHPDVKLLMFDHNKDHAVAWGETILDENNPASAYVDGTAIHWYAGGMDRLLDGALGQPNMHRFMSMLKYQNVSEDHLILGSEACHCPTTGYYGGDINVAWARAERYAHTILADLAAGSNGWVEWNLVLDSIGGPNHLGNLCDSPLLAVPYRAGGEHNISWLPDFEHTGYLNGPGTSRGDSRTREELNSMGMPAEYIDRGVIVQPMYYYMGHISRHVRPGSRAVPALVDQSNLGPNERTFREIVGNTSVAGGGVNDLARVGIELTLWPCEGSTRQVWEFSKDGRLQVFGHDWLGVPTASCVSKTPDKSFGGLALTTCDHLAASFDMSVIKEGGDSYNMILTNSIEKEAQICLIAKPLESNGGAYGPRGGAQVTLGECNGDAALFEFNKMTGELTSSLFENEGGDVCMTTGWPFLQVGGFIDRNEGKKTVVILNEASDNANYVLRGDEGDILMTSSIPGHSIQTLVL
uniref:Glycosyl hydrolase family 30 TIM-barrel domain-containing protein n=1 Tax=Chaetoceros debilis TaxID=122233 RepID=A0A7S3QAP9_9STRA